MANLSSPIATSKGAKKRARKAKALHLKRTAAHGSWDESALSEEVQKIIKGTLWILAYVCIQIL